MAMVCGALPIIGKSWVGVWGRGWHIYSKSDKQLVLFPAVEGFKAWWQTASPSDGTNCHWQCLTPLRHTDWVVLFCFSASSVQIPAFIFYVFFFSLIPDTQWKHNLTLWPFFTGWNQLMYEFVLQKTNLCHLKGTQLIASILIGSD